MRDLIIKMVLSNIAFDQENGIDDDNYQIFKRFIHDDYFQKRIINLILNNNLDLKLSSWALKHMQNNDFNEALKEAPFHYDFHLDVLRFGKMIIQEEEQILNLLIKVMKEPKGTFIVTKILEDLKNMDIDTLDKEDYDIVLKLQTDINYLEDNVLNIFANGGFNNDYLNELIFYCQNNAKKKAYFSKK